MTEKTAATITLISCTSCGKPIPPAAQATKFMCPSCGEIQIKRDQKCRKFGRPYKCPRCGFIGP
ncbi:MAG TPA: zinc finger domain-containing protein [Candidatus Acidoferrum sp.]|nr:zinc finger domain-containing protein [Candidatus Acidoferrum sp.]